MAVSTRSVGRALAGIVGAERVSERPDALAAAAVDGVAPRFAVRPATADHVAGVLALAFEERLAVVPRGSGAALALGRPPERVDVALDVRDLADIVEYSPDDMTATVQAGVTLGALAQALGRRGQWLPVDPPGAARRTVGGITATRASGPLRFRYGTMRDLLLGVRFVQADGVPTWGGAKVVKSVSGYDVPKLMVGALGTLGVLTELTVRLHPRPPAEATWLALFEAVEAAQEFALRLLDSTIQPLAVEFFDAAALRAIPAEAATAGIAVRIGSVEEAVRAQGEALDRIASAAGARVVGAPDGFWGSAAEAVEPGVDEVDLAIATLPGRLAATVTALADGAGGLGSEAAYLTTGCAALGTLRAVITGAAVDAVATLVERLRDVVAADGGGVVVQAGPRALRERVDPWGPVDAGALALMRAIRDEFDPRRVLNPGRFVGDL